MATPHVISVLLTGSDVSLSRVLHSSAREVDAFGRKVDDAGKQTTSTGKLMGAAIAAGATILAAGFAYAIYQAAAFETQLRNVNSIAKMSEADLAATGQELLNLSRRLPQSATTLAKGLYDVASSGFAGADGMKILTASAVAASAGMTDTATAAKAITSVINAYGLTAASAADVSDVLFKTVELGVVTFEELAGTIGDVVGTAAAASVNIDEVGAAIATMTLSGIGAAEAGTSLNRLLQSLIDPSESLADALRNVGYESGLQALQTDDLNVVLERLRVASKGNVETLLQWFPEIRAARGALALMANEGQNAGRVFGVLTDEQQRAQSTQAAFNEQMKATAAQVRIVLNQVNAFAIEMGLRLLPVVQQGIAAFYELAHRVWPGLQAAGERLQPLFEQLGRILANVAEIVETVGRAAGPTALALAALIGAGLLEALEAAAGALEEVTGFLADNEGAAKALAVVVGAALVPSLWAAVVALKAMVVSAVETGVLKLLYAWDAVTASIAGFGRAVASAARFAASNLALMGASLGAVGLAIAGVTFFLSRKAEREAEGRRLVDLYTAAIQDQTGALEDNVDAATAADLVQGAFGKKLREAGADWRALRVGIRENSDELEGLSRAVDTAEEGMSLALDQLRDGLRETGLEGSALGDELLRLAESGQFAGHEFDDLLKTLSTMAVSEDEARAQAEALGDSVEGTGESSDGAAPKIDELGAAAKRLDEQLQRTEEAVKGLNDALKAQFDPLFGMIDATDGLAEAQRKLAEVQADGEATERDLERAHEDVAKAALAVESAAIDLTGAILLGNVSVDQAVGKLRGWVAQGLITEDQAVEMERQFREAAEGALAIPTGVHTVVSTETGQAVAGISDVQARLNRLTERGWNVRLDFYAGRLPAIGGAPLARGGVVAAQQGLAAGVYRGTMIKAFEPETGGELYLPRLGDRGRGRSLLGVGASWYGMRVVPAQRGLLVGSVPTRGGDDRLVAEVRALRRALHEARPVNVYPQDGDGARMIVDEMMLRSKVGG